MQNKESEPRHLRRSSQQATGYILCAVRGLYEATPLRSVYCRCLANLSFPMHMPQRRTGEVFSSHHTRLSHSSWGNPKNLANYSQPIRRFALPIADSHQNRFAGPTNADFGTNVALGRALGESPCVSAHRSRRASGKQPGAFTHTKPVV